MSLRGGIIFLFWAVAAHAQQWDTLKNCRLVPNELGNDGDSFHVSAGGKEYLFRLYFADSPEDSEQIPARVEEQASYFGTTPENILATGKIAKEFTAKLLAEPFTVVTCWQDAKGASRMNRNFAFVYPKDHEPDLATQLLENGLARSYGATAAPPGKNERTLRSDYDHAQAQARQRGLGAWGSNSQAPKNASSSNRAPLSNSFTPPPLTPTPLAKPLTAAAPKSDSSKINLNTATQAELKSLPKIGDVISRRIIEGRPYESVADLERIQGINAATVEVIQDLVTVN